MAIVEFISLVHPELYNNFYSGYILQLLKCFKLKLKQKMSVDYFVIFGNFFNHTACEQAHMPR